MLKQAYRYLKFEELLIFALAIIKTKYERESIAFDKRYVDKIKILLVLFLIH